MSVGFTAVVARPVVHHCLRSATRTGEPGVAVAAVVVLVLLSSAGTQALGLEPILGAFLCGILIGSAPLTAPLTPPPDLTSLRTFVIAVLAPLFFVCAGQRMDLTALCEPTVLVAGVGVLLVAIGGKFVGAYAGARLGRLGHWPGLAIAAGLNARGVVEIVIAMAGLRLGVLTTASFTVIVLVAVVTTIMAAPLLRLAARHLAIDRDLLSWPPVTSRSPRRNRPGNGSCSDRPAKHGPENRAAVPPTPCRLHRAAHHAPACPPSFSRAATSRSQSLFGDR